MNHEITNVYPSEDEQLYRIPNQERGLGTHENLIGRLKESEYTPEREYELIDSDGATYSATLTGLVEVSEHKTIDAHNQDAQDRLIQVAITKRIKVDEQGQLHNALGTKWVPIGDVLDSMHKDLGADEYERVAARAVGLGSKAVSLTNLHDRADKVIARSTDARRSSSGRLAA